MTAHDHKFVIVVAALRKEIEDIYPPHLDEIVTIRRSRMVAILDALDAAWQERDGLRSEVARLALALEVAYGRLAVAQGATRRMTPSAAGAGEVE